MGREKRVQLLALLAKDSVDFLQPCARRQTGVRLLQDRGFLLIKNSEDFAWVRYRGEALGEIDADLVEHTKQHRPPLVGLIIRASERSQVVDHLTQDRVDLQRRPVHSGQLLLRLRLRLRLDDRVNLGDRKSRLMLQIQQRNALPNFSGAESLGSQGDDEIPVGFIHPPVGPTDRVLVST